jgi:hypothetical protein
LIAAKFIKPGAVNVPSKSNNTAFSCSIFILLFFHELVILYKVSEVE